MLVRSVSIRFEGSYNLAKLANFNFKLLHKSGRLDYNYLYRFDGILHRYTFTPIDNIHVRLTIRPKRQDVELPYQITLGNLGSDVKEWIKAIQ